MLCKFKNIKIKAFSKNWKPYALIGLFNIAIPFTLIAIGTSEINSYLAAMLMSTTPMSGSILAHFFTKDEKITFFKSIGILVGFSGVVFLFFDKLVINENNYIFALITILGSTFYSIGGILTLKLKRRVMKMLLLPQHYGLSFYFHFHQHLRHHGNLSTIESTLALFYLGVVATGLLGYQI